MGGSTIATSETKIEALKLQSSAYGVTIPVLGGVNRLPGNLIWYGDFKAVAHTSTQSQGGKGGGVKTQNTTYTYSASVLMGICQGPVGAIARVWKGKEVFGGGYAPAAVATAAETYTPPGSGAMTYTLAHGATLIGVPTITFTLVEDVSGEVTGWTIERQATLAEGADFTLAGSLITITNETVRGVELAINYQYGTSAPDMAALTELGITLANGAINQSAAAWLASAHPGESLAYPGLVYVHAQDYGLGSGAQVDNHSFEVQGSGAYRYGSTLPDCNPWEFAADVLSNGRYGARMPSDTTEVQAGIDYAAAAGLLMSPALTEQQRAADFIEQLCRFTNCAPVWSYDRLRIVPFGDVAITGNGVTYTPNTTPLYDLDDDCWLQEGADDPLTWTLKEPSDRFNHVRVEFDDRATGYAKNIAEAKDDADIAVNGLRTMSTISAPWICDAAVAALVARIVMQRSLNITGRGVVRLPWAYCLLECMDLVTLTDSALSFLRQPVRIVAISEDEGGMLEVEVEDWPLGSASPIRYPSQVASGFQHDYNVAPGAVAAPVIFEAPAELTATGIEVYAAVRGTSAAWAGAQVWVSLDGTNYRQAGVVYGGSRYGTLSSAASAGAASLAVAGLGAQQLISGGPADAAKLTTLCYIGGAAPEYLAYETATLTGAGAYTLSGLVHAAYGTAAAAHASGVPFVRVDDALAHSGPIEPSFVGQTLYFKFCSFNLYGGAQQTLADVSAYTYTVTGAMAALSVPLGSKVYRQGTDPALAGFVPGGALWYDTAHNNAPYLRQAGAWLAVRDGDIAAAAGAASAAAGAAATALGLLTDIASDSLLTPDEKPRVIQDVSVITTEQAGIDAQATNYAITTEKTVYDAAVTALTGYLGGLTSPVSWNNLTGNTTIVGGTFRAKFSDLYIARQAVLDKIAANAKARLGALATLNTVGTGQIDAGSATGIYSASASGITVDGQTGTPTGDFTTLVTYTFTPAVDCEVLIGAEGYATITTPASGFNGDYAVLSTRLRANATQLGPLRTNAIDFRVGFSQSVGAAINRQQRFAATGGVSYTITLEAQKLSPLVDTLVNTVAMRVEEIKR